MICSKYTVAVTAKKPPSITGGPARESNIEPAPPYGEYTLAPRRSRPYLFAALSFLAVALLYTLIVGR